MRLCGLVFYIDFSLYFMLWPDPVGAFLAPFQVREVGRLGLSSVASTPASGAPAFFISDRVSIFLPLPFGRGWGGCTLLLLDISVLSDRFCHFFGS